MLTTDEKKDLLEYAIIGTAYNKDEKWCRGQIIDFAINVYGLNDDTLDRLCYFYFGYDFNEDALHDEF